jgi:phosphatidylglycerol lysyltransferase
MAFIQTTANYNDIYPTNGLHSLLIGADAVVELDQFINTTIHNKYFRNIVNRFEKQGFSVTRHQPPHQNELIGELRLVSDSWLKLPHRKEWSFLTGRFDNAYLQQVKLYVLRDKQGRIQAFTNESPSFKPGIATIDLMRHRHNSPSNSIDFLFIRLMKMLHNDGYTGFNLGMSPLDGKPFSANLSAKLLMQLYGISDNFIGFKGLHQFKAKYEPQWEPRYVWYQGSPLRLAQIGLAILSLMNHA